MKIKKNFSQLANSSNNIDSYIFFLFPPNSSGIFKETQKLFSWQESNLTGGLGTVAGTQASRHRSPEGCREGRRILCPPTVSSWQTGQFLPFLTTCSLTPPFYRSLPAPQEAVLLLKVPNCI